MNIYVGNLSSDVTEQDLRQIFEPYGAPSSVAIIKDKFSGEPRGFAFVEMPQGDSAKTAVAELNGKELNGKSIIVNEARPREERGGSRGGFGGGNRGGSSRSGSSRSGSGGGYGGGNRSQRY